MPSTHRLQANFTNRIGQELPTVPGLQAMYFFGTGGDGINSNRVAGGAAPIVSPSAPPYSANYVTCGYDGTTSRWIDMNIQRSAAQLAAGWTWAVVARAGSTGAAAAPLIIDAGGGGGTIPGQASCGGFSLQSATSHSAYIYSIGATVRATLAMPGVGSAWHFVAETYTGGAAGTWSLSEYTDNIAGTTPVTYVTSGLASGTNSPTLGGEVPNWSASFTIQADIAFAMCAQGVMSQASIAALAAAVRPWLARRGIVM